MANEIKTFTAKPSKVVTMSRLEDWRRLWQIPIYAALVDPIKNSLAALEEAAMQWQTVRKVGPGMLVVGLQNNPMPSLGETQAIINLVCAIEAVDVVVPIDGSERLTFIERVRANWFVVDDTKLRAGLLDPEELQAITRHCKLYKEPKGTS